jgi:hypothetical protein
MKRHIDKYDEENSLDHPDLEYTREKARKELIAFLDDSARGLDTSAFIRRFSRDNLFRRMVAPGIAADIEFDPPPSTFSKLEQARDAEALDAMKKYGLPAVDFSTWELP